MRLLQGAVDVALPRAPASPQPPIRRLVTGEGVSFAVQPDVPATPTASTGVQTVLPPAAREFKAMPVAELVALANHDAARPIRLADASLGSQRVSGRFRIDDTGLLAGRLGILFGRNVDESDPREIVLPRADD